MRTLGSTGTSSSRHVPRIGFFPSDYRLSYRTLSALLRLDGEARQLCDWGSRFGVVAGLGVLLGYEAHGNGDLQKIYGGNIMRVFKQVWKW